LGNHFILPGGPIEEPVPLLRVEDLLGPDDEPSGGVREPRRPLPGSEPATPVVTWGMTLLTGSQMEAWRHCRWQDGPVSKAAVDLFDGPSWSTDVSGGQPTVDSGRLALLVSLALTGLLMGSMALPWFTSAETPSWTPFSHWLDLGWSPGTRNWAILVFGLSAGVAVGIAVVLRSAGKLGMILLLLASTGLLVVILLEATANLSVDPGPSLHADYGAIVGAWAAALLWVSLAFGLHLKIRQ